MKKISAVFLCLLLLAPAGFPAELFDWLKQPYVEHPVAPVDLSNSPRIQQLLRAGNIYLSLSDAIALAIENNLDIELERYTLPAADTELLRAKGGGVLRGLTYNVFEVPVGVGGPASPLVTIGGVAHRGRRGTRCRPIPPNSARCPSAGQSFHAPDRSAFHRPGHSAIRPRAHRAAELDAPDHARYESVGLRHQRSVTATPPTPTRRTRRASAPARN